MVRNEGNCLLAVCDDEHNISRAVVGGDRACFDAMRVDQPNIVAEVISSILLIILLPYLYIYIYYLPKKEILQLT
jgi:hypothetical protein